MSIIHMDNWVVIGFTDVDGVNLYINGDVIYSKNNCMKDSALLEIEYFDPFTPIAYSEKFEIRLSLNGEMVSISEDICSSSMAKDLIVCALVNESANKLHHNILDLINKDSFKIEYAA